MLVLLPPSEGKATTGDGPPVDLDGLTRPELTRTRERVLDTLITLCAGPERRAMDVLGLPAGQADALQRNRVLRSAATLPTARLYTGVLYDNLGLADLDGAAYARAAERLAIFSGLWGVLRIGDRVPPYRLAMGVRLPWLGALAGVWRPALAEAMSAEDPGLIVDMRSAPYAAAWRPAVPTVAVRVLRERIAGGVVRRSVVSHMAKATRGAVTRDLIVAGADPRSPEELAKILGDLGHVVELKGPARSGAPWTAEVILSDPCEPGH
ncbi:peroxide stress protein YaaA [Actinomadura sp. HBU206391]|uniref:peroxide stress protein YaaA n=1 Tax=Actinomadura sp. HBU206391 TaxID=2731692 RepID=UPI00164F1580|nr:peroxide stress protein YaaA [Actinomadura sp. HBU206391]MBC6459022.1 peroxide stress protein YaaA [Actinomadura sp. HBU206391]